MTCPSVAQALEREPEVAVVDVLVAGPVVHGHVDDDAAVRRGGPAQGGAVLAAGPEVEARRARVVERGEAHAGDLAVDADRGEGLAALVGLDAQAGPERVAALDLAPDDLAREGGVRRRLV